MTKGRSHFRLRAVRSAMRADLVQFALPAIVVFIAEVDFCRRDGLSGIWGTLWGVITHPQQLLSLPMHASVGLALFTIGLAVAVTGQLTLGRSYSGTVVIWEGHRLITHGIYRYIRNPMYLGVLTALLGLPVYAASLYGFLTGLVLIPLFLNRIRLEERLLTEQYGDSYLAYLAKTKRLIPFVY